MNIKHFYFFTFMVVECPSKADYANEQIDRGIRIGLEDRHAEPIRVWITHIVP